MVAITLQQCIAIYTCRVHRWCGANNDRLLELQETIASPRSLMSARVDWRRMRFPRALQDRLQELLDRQDREGKLTARERREATALAELVDLFSLMRVEAQLADRRKRA
jgi:hypothetical protein